jgi:hypothetical protein
VDAPPVNKYKLFVLEVIAGVKGSGSSERQNNSGSRLRRIRGGWRNNGIEITKAAAAPVFGFMPSEMPMKRDGADDLGSPSSSMGH